MKKDAVKVIVYDVDGRVLVLRRSKTHPTLPLHPDLPGGYVDAGESHVEAAIREVHEETGFQLSIDGLQHERTEYLPHGVTWAIFSARLEGSMPPVTISWEHDQHNWLQVREFTSLVKPAHPDYFLDLTKQHLAAIYSA